MHIFVEPVTIICCVDDISLCNIFLCRYAVETAAAYKCNGWAIYNGHGG